MKHTSFTIINLIILGIGILFIAACRRPDFINSLVFFTGIAFIVPGVINAFNLMIQGNKNKNTKNETEPNAETKNETPKQSSWSRFIGWTVSIASILLGAMMCFIPETFRTPLIYIFAVFFFLGGFYHLYMLWRGLRPATINRWLLILPALIIAVACVLIFIPSLRTDTNQTTVSLLSGIALILFAVTSFFEGVAIRAYNRRVANLNDTPIDSSNHQIHS